MKETAVDIDGYFASLPAQRQQPMRRLREVILANLPSGFEEVDAGNAELCSAADNRS